MKSIIVIAGGGTGGHIYPGVAIAKSIEMLDSEFEIHFVGSELGLETKIIPREGYELHLLPAGKLNYQGGWLNKLKTLLKLPLAFLKSIVWLKKHNPKFVLGVGGYASGPFVFAATVLGFPTAIWEPNAHPGMTNRILSKWVNKCYLVFEEARLTLKSTSIVKVGLPVRPELESMKINPREDTEFHVLCFGGSQGARYINRVFLESVKSEPEWLHKAKLIHQTGIADYAEINSVYQKSIFSVKPFEFLHEMNQFYDWADLIICRSGASTVAELAAVGKAAVFIPLPTSADNHQLKNAQSVALGGGAILLEQSQLNKDSLNKIIMNLQKHPDELQKMAKKIKFFHQPKSADVIAKDILTTIAENKGK